ncbi:ribonuclease catalytic domain-containing protein [Noviherbaspirillum pedocola]|uniref:RNB domain-containing ribonuclease n=1 Tax=Noviherbaspirillum pedocola TaxID=2801341 RepID=A0A934SVC4_9BURK|nr:RNB domain-containing ribonuclease [Noviherbaspirillum pedocola]MBK4733472.1 RNB domain-containing ribonuclease [Noviherbaspirillum pedocola]
MNLFFEESGDFKAGSVLSQQGEAYQVELQTGKRAKVRARDVLLQFATPEPAEMLAAAQRIADEVDLDFLWEVAGQEEFGFAELGTEYFGHAPQPHEAAGLLLKLHSAPIYFQRKGRGRYKAAPETTLKAALAGLERKRLQAEQQAAYVEELKAGRLPEAIRAAATQLLFRPDKNSIEYKALETAANDMQTTRERLMLSVGAIPSPKALHLTRFLLEHFPRGVGFPAVTMPARPKLAVAEVQAFSIDDVTTTEIDDAFSVTWLDEGRVRIGIHIAAPGLGIARGDAIDAIARSRMSTVYMPGEKITMLPDALVEVFTLAEGQDCPALSLYVTLDTTNWNVLATDTRAEMVPMAANLRHNLLDEQVTEENLASGGGDYPYKREITLLWQWAQVLERGRMAKREAFGLKPEQNNRVDFNFYVEDEVVTITRRKRGAPLDKLVAELMIYANSSWGRLMHDHGVPGIYRIQGGGNWATRMQVRMVTHAAPHQGLGVDQYAWSTSPLRRYTDLVNQWQILACVEHGVTAPLAATFKPKDADLYAIVSAFDSAYSSYAEFQTVMERYWCLRWLAQHEARVVEAVALKEEIMRLVEIPLVLKLPGMSPLPRGTAVKLDLLRWDEVDLSVEARLIEVESAPGAESLAEAEDALADEEELAEGMPPLEAQIDPAQAEEAAESVAANPAGDAAG